MKDEKRMFNLSAIHDVNTGIILTTLTIAYIKSRKLEPSHFSGFLALATFILSILPTPLHGTGIWGIATLLTTYIFFIRTWGNKEIALLLLTAVVLMMINIGLGLKLRGIF
ncbi:MAG TPA: hypothetical protein VER35_01055 [Candidatus Limnocylindrales bacterium]|nr:hypothetical protein [Candidatus Limnocylindrales bacterium]